MPGAILAQGCPGQCSYLVTAQAALQVLQGCPRLLLKGCALGQGWG